MTVKHKITTLIAAGALFFASVQPGFAAIEIDEQDFGPSYGTMMADTLAGKPLQLINAIAGTTAFVVGLPFSIASRSVPEARQKLVTEPWQALNRCLGCTVAEDNYYKSQAENKQVVRIVVDQPSEILINTSDEVVINQ